MSFFLFDNEIPLVNTNSLQTYLNKFYLDAKKYSKIYVYTFNIRRHFMNR